MNPRKLAFLFYTRMWAATLIALLTASCNLVSPRGQEAAPEASGKTELNEEASQNCTDFKRPLNPAAEPVPSESDLDRYFRLAYSHEIEGDFDEAILNYRRAAELSSCDCDRLHAEAGEKAAREAREVFQKGGMATRPTQFFWGRLQELTQILPCVEIK